ncbi:polyribonucleotide 5'-hydroxyl-kinase Clp1-like [Acyrthosiphon pisum]|uniref:Uncharacterized protein n=1 Tax=Acyrthosiphon pisum TaxID=7029 RepID=A0A8R2NJF0_ACYPI|nr:polyribonucleotide 5'-hydroxyl-kinase Clp1-like [Acyrthosiphon pisum]
MAEVIHQQMNENPRNVLFNLHASLEQLREKEKIRGPVTMLVGPTDVDKSTLCRILLNYSAQMNALDIDSSMSIWIRVRNKYQFQEQLIVERSYKFRLKGRKARIREFFYGNPRNVLHPHTCVVRSSDIKVYRIGAPSIPNPLKPLDMQKTN